jgi:hypothetical protein
MKRRAILYGANTGADIRSSAPFSLSLSLSLCLFIYIHPSISIFLYPFSEKRGRPLQMT